MMRVNASDSLIGARAFSDVFRIVSRFQIAMALSNQYRGHDAAAIAHILGNLDQLWLAND